MSQRVGAQNDGTASNSRTRKRVLGILFLAAAVAGTAAVVASSGSHSGIVLLTHAGGDKGRTELADGRGVLRFDAERGCVYLEGADGTRKLPQWPEGYHARSDPVRVYDADDALIAEQGQLVTFAGGFHDPAELASGTETCGVVAVDGLFIMGSPVSR
jgi:hypothetical protein